MAGPHAGGRAAGAISEAMVILFLAVTPSALALDPLLELSQYSHKAWRVRDGFATGAIHAIAQTPDGYLWLGTDFGLTRFDGFRNVPWQPPPDQHLPSVVTTKLLAAQDGTLWIGTDRGLATWKNGRLSVFAELAGQLVLALLEDHEGSVWVGSVSPSVGKLCKFRDDRLQCFAEDGRLGRGVVSLYEHEGSLWAAASTGLWRWTPEPRKVHPRTTLSEITALTQGDNGALWFAMGLGIKQYFEGKVEPYQLARTAEVHIRRLLRDRDGGLWMGTNGHGLLHSYRGRTDAFTALDGLSGDFVSSLYEGREGAVWVATDGGLDRFRTLAVHTITARQGLSGRSLSAVLASDDGSVWLSSDTGLSKWKGGDTTIYAKPDGRSSLQIQNAASRRVDAGSLPDNSLESLYQDSRGRIWIATRGGLGYFENGRFASVESTPRQMIARAIAGDGKDNLWVADLSLGLLHLSSTGFMEPLEWDKLGHKDFAPRLAFDPAQGGLWVGFYEGGVSYVKEGRVLRSLAAADGLGAGRVNDLRIDTEGSLWVATEGGLSRLKNGAIATLGGKNGLPCETTHWSIEDNDRSIWLGTICGLVRIARPEVEAWIADPGRIVRPAIFDASDGVLSKAWSASFSPEAAKTPDGKIWFLNADGVGVIDPERLPFSTLAAPVHIELIVANREEHEPKGRLRLPPLIRDLRIDYTALSLTAPEKIRFRYKLEGKDTDWQDAGDRRQAFYNDLPPRRYRFRVMACNYSGVWNETGASFEFSIPPAYYQATWFRLSCGAAVLALLAGLYSWRLRQVELRFTQRLDARVHERTRIARELHDTLLQSFQGVLMKFDTALGLIQNRPAEAEEMLETAVEQARKAITEGRDAVQGLRSSTVVGNDLADAIGVLGGELAGQYAGPRCPAFRVHADGESRELEPLVRDEIHRVASEAVRNAFRHAEASRIDVELRYDKRQFRLRVRDDGKGIDQGVLTSSGRDGHFGLPGMQERAKVVDGKLVVFSRPGAGTEVELTIPGAFAYPRSAPTHPPMSRGRGA